MKKSITFKISDLDLLKIKKEASESGMMISEYVRKVIESSIDLHDIADELREIKKDLNYLVERERQNEHEQK
jgi:hypothetical protein